MSLSRIEIDLLALINAGRPHDVLAQMQSLAWLTPAPDGNGYQPNREAREFAAKLTRLHLPIPWQTPE